MPKSSMVNIGIHTYAVGRQAVTLLDEEHSDLLQGTRNVTTFTRMFKNSIMYYSTQFGHSSYKRDNTHCSYSDENGDTCYGQIEQFVCAQEPVAFIQVKPLAASLLSTAGHPCRDSLIKYVTADILSLYIIPVESSASLLKLVPVSRIK